MLPLTKTSEVLASPSTGQPAGARPAQQGPSPAKTPLRFGPPAALGPLPRTLQRIPPLPPIPDTALDWVDLGSIAVRAASCRGHLKRFEGEPRQDAYALGQVGDYVVVAVADGVGSARLSHLGASLASAAAASGGHAPLLDTAGAMLADQAPRWESLDGIAARLQQRAAELESPVADLSTTLLIAAIPMNRPFDPEDGIDVVIWQLGDSPSGRIDSEGLRIRASGADSGQALSNTQVEALPALAKAAVRVERFAPGETLVLMTDGVSNPASLNDEFAAALAALWQRSTPTPAALLEVLDATLRSFDDDRTFVGIRFTGTDRDAHG